MPVLPIGRIPAFWAARDADKPALTHEGRTVTWGEFDRATNRLARAYAALGVKEGDLVTIGLPNGIGFYEACFATWKLGATPQPISARLPLAEREMIVEVAAPSLVVGAAPGAHGAVTGMSVQVEVRTGDRRVIEYLLTPLLRYKEEAIRER